MVNESNGLCCVMIVNNCDNGDLWCEEKCSGDCVFL